jgi:hypothetical protein
LKPASFRDSFFNFIFVIIKKGFTKSNKNGQSKPMRDTCSIHQKKKIRKTGTLSICCARYYLLWKEEGKKEFNTSVAYWVCVDLIGGDVAFRAINWPLASSFFFSSWLNNKKKKNPLFSACGYLFHDFQTTTTTTQRKKKRQSTV